MSARVFKRIGTTNLYRINPFLSGEHILYFTKSGDSEIPLNETWSDSGTPEFVGYYLFVSNLPTGPEAIQLSTYLTPHFPENPTATGLVWVAGPTAAAGSAGDVEYEIQCLLALDLNSENEPWIEKSTVVMSAPGMKAIGLTAQSPVRAGQSDGQLSALSVSYPPQMAHEGEPTAQPPVGQALRVALTGGDAGCLFFSGLINNQSLDFEAEYMKKSLVNVQLNLLAPANSNMTLTGQDYFLCRNDSGYHIYLAAN